jgi:hypothetical protein
MPYLYIPSPSHGFGQYSALAAAIAGIENAPASWNNPGGLVSNPWTQSLPGYVGQTPNGLAMFATLADGQAAEQANIQNYVNGGYTIQGMLNMWAPSGASNDPTGLNNPTLYAQEVSASLGLSPSDLVSAATDSASNDLSTSGIDLSSVDLSSLGIDLSSVGGPVISGQTVALGLGVLVLGLLALELV